MDQKQATARKNVSIENVLQEALNAQQMGKQPKPLIIDSPISVRAWMLEGIMPFQLKPIDYKNLK